MAYACIYFVSASGGSAEGRKTVQVVEIVQIEKKGGRAAL